MMEPLRTAVIGVGHFGQYHAEKFARVPGSRLVAVADIDAARGRAIASRYGVEAVTDHRALLGRVDAVSVATPPRAHYEIARAFLENGAHVLVEKPIAAELDHAATLIRIARERGRVLQVGHLERFSAAGRALQRIVSRPLYVEAVRVGPFQRRTTDVNAVLDLMIHDLDLILAFVNSPIEWVHAAGAPVFSSAEDIASSRIQFANGCVANLTASRVSRIAKRRMFVYQPDSYTAINFVQKTMKIVRRASGESLPGVPNLHTEEISYGDADTLEQEIVAFLRAVRTGSPPEVTGEDGWRALNAALMITRSLQAYWQAVEDGDPAAGAVAAAARG
ncbi:MAG: Gfo/Idh/MocA family oxidoreductase [Dongiaceae bacterium]